MVPFPGGRVGEGDGERAEQAAVGATQSRQSADDDAAQHSHPVSSSTESPYAGIQRHQSCGSDDNEFLKISSHTYLPMKR